MGSLENGLLQHTQVRFRHNFSDALPKIKFLGEHQVKRFLPTSLFGTGV